jgi:hypothetical protein
MTFWQFRSEKGNQDIELNKQDRKYGSSTIFLLKIRKHKPKNRTEILLEKSINKYR